MLPLSHDEVVHGKKSLLGKMAGDPWQQLANLRLLFSYQYTRPGKVLLFMGSELADPREWDHDGSLPWHLAEGPARAGLQLLLGDLGRTVRAHPCLHRRDHERDGFAWIDCDDQDRSLISYLRRDGDDFVLVVLNFTPVPRPGYRVGVPQAGRYRELISTDAERYGGGGFATLAEVEADAATPWHGQPASVALDLPPLAALVLQPAP